MIVERNKEMPIINGSQESLNKKKFSSGLKNLDKILKGVAAGDNIVWQVDQIKDYIAFVHPFCRYAYKNSKELIYFRFADHIELLPDNVKAEKFFLDPKHGFEHLIQKFLKKLKHMDAEFVMFLIRFHVFLMPGIVIRWLLIFSCLLALTCIILKQQLILL